MGSAIVSSGGVGMGFREFLFLGFVVVYLILGSNGREEASISWKKNLELERQLKLLNKPARTSIKAKDGSIFDCVDINKQPAFDHPLLKNHTIQMRPNFFPSGMINEVSSPLKPSEVELKSGECPQGTVLIRRTRKEDLLAAKTLSKRYVRNIHPLASEPSGYHSAIVKTIQDPSIKYHGAMASMNLYSPRVSVDQFSESAIWVQNSVTDALNSIQVGWAVNPTLFGDNKTRIFSYWTADGFQKTGCFNTLCPGFVQVSKVYTMGSVLDPVSTYDGKQYDLQVLVYKDPKTGNWWLTLGNNNETVGYWPSSIFTGLASFASEVEWGGEVYNPETEASPQMGSGDFWSQKVGRTCYMKFMQLVNEEDKVVDPVDVGMLATAGDGYGVQYNGYSGESMGYFMFYGGPI